MSYRPKHWEPAYPPKTLVHPHAVKGAARQIVGHDPVTGRGFIDHQGAPDRFAPVTVNTPDQEAEYRAKGYLEIGEKAPGMTEHQEYPIWMSHPEHQDHVPATDSRKAQPEKFPDALAQSKAQEAALLAKGYARPGKSDPEAVETAGAVPYVPGQVSQEYPRWEGDSLVDPHAVVAGPIEYPKWVQPEGKEPVLVNDRREENQVLGVAPEPPAKRKALTLAAG